MIKGLGWICALALVCSTLAPAASEPAEAIAHHDLHPGLDHPAPGEGHHEHGDADDHHETPDSPCHHHEAHTCCSAGLTFAMFGSPAGPDAVHFTRILIPTFHSHTAPALVELLHVPLA